MNQDQVRKSLSELVERHDLPADVKGALSNAVSALATPLQTDVWVYRIVVTVLGIAVLVTVIGGIFLAYAGGGNQTLSLPEGIVAIGSAAVGALAGLLAPSPRGG